MLPVDHVALAVPDLGLAAGALEEAGYTVSPRADHPFGTSNRLVVLDNAYLELVSVTRPDRVRGDFATSVRRRVAEGGGIVAIALRSIDLELERHRFGLLGVATSDRFDFERPAPLPDGSSMQAAFSLVFLPATEPTTLFLCVHHTPDAIWHESLLSHANGASHLTGVSIGTPAPRWVDEVADEIAFDDREEIRIDAGGPVVIGDVHVG